MSPKMASIEKTQLRDKTPEFRIGDAVRVHYQIREGDKERVQVFHGVVIRRQRAGARSTFTVRKVSYGVGVERVFLLHSPRIEKLEVGSHGHVRRSRLYYLRDLKGKAARIREKTAVAVPNEGSEP
ncbi:MAG: 50S ribosomal protein L19 [Deltaproteobacteria bacterium]|nr:50S ribosomal protein L19 [Deltaproteobacteria bacterium]